MTKARRYDTVLLLEAVGCLPKGAKGAVVEVYTSPYEAYDIEIVSEEGKTEGLAEAVRPDQIQVLSLKPESVRLTSVRIADGGARAEVSFSDGTEVTVGAEDLYARRD